MKIAFVGKGGSGKTTISSLFSRYIAGQKLPVLAIDADINQHLGVALGLAHDEASTLPPMGMEINRIKEYLRGNNPLISSTEAMMKTTPPGRGSRLIRLMEDNPIYSYFQKTVDGVRIMATGPFSESDLGLKCYHSKVGAVELLLNHLVDGQKEYVVVDMTAGADSFASGMFTRFDVTFLVLEPTLKGLSVYRQYKEYSKDFEVKVVVVGNKIEGQSDIDFLREHVGDDLVTCFNGSGYVRDMEKGSHLPLEQLETANLEALKIMLKEVDACPKDWVKFYRQAVEFHVKNALGWANASAGEDLTKQVDKEFALPPGVAAR